MSTLSKNFDAFLRARGALFADLDLPPGHVEDHRAHRWSGDHGAVWWEDGEGRRHDASTTSHSVSKDGLYVVRDVRGHAWLVFSLDREDPGFAY